MPSLPRLGHLNENGCMQGTAGTESVELYEMYNLPVERVPPHRPVLRIDNAMEVSDH